ncbi:MAG: hypothetical protein FJ042_05050 [Candidatus Cloacimonetes bacterium]|nr:hypothetical protein [Candidatus Cloacimonadota bacterium]
MGKVKSFAAKLAHDTTTEGKVICPVCKTEVKRIKLVKNKKGQTGWSPDQESVKICQCNEAAIYTGKIL